MFDGVTFDGVGDVLDSGRSPQGSIPLRKEKLQNFTPQKTGYTPLSNPKLTLNEESDSHIFIQI